ncbi:PH domain-containing protein [Paenibacillus sp. sgz500958]|uniref:PH domain-containing protein n=1 Tax=Paenibacillus sp. sgz500958 TaxID=3242475 RepID=UPI0036D39957
MSYCTSCGAKYEQDAKFCGECGAPTDHAAPQASHLSAVHESPSHEVVLWEGKPAGISDRLKGIIGLNTTTYTITSQRIRVKTGLIAKKFEEVELLRVRDLAVQQSVMDRILRIGTLTVFSEDTSSPQLNFRKIRDPQTVKDVLRTAIRDEKTANKLSYREQI